MKITYTITDKSQYGSGFREDKVLSLTLERDGKTMELKDSEVRELMATMEGKRRIFETGQPGDWISVLINY